LGINRLDEDLKVYQTIRELPHGLRVGGDLYLPGTGIKTLPASAKVGGKIFYDDYKSK
jgi:hypothetical protein